MIVSALFFYLFAGVCIASALHGDRGEESRALGAVPDPRLRQRGRPVRADGRRVPRDDPDRGLCRRGRGAVPVRGDDARRRFRRAAPGLPAIPADRRAGRHRVPGRAAAGGRRLDDRAGDRRRRSPRRSRRLLGDQHRGARARALHPLRLLLPGRRPDPAGRHDRRHRADAAAQAERQAPEHLASRSRAPARTRSRS